jgi:hypothetical protein
VTDYSAAASTSSGVGFPRLSPEFREMLEYFQDVVIPCRLQ